MKSLNMDESTPASDLEMSILTDPLPWGRELLSEGARSIVRVARRRIHPLGADAGPYRGHPAVTRSLVVGLDKMHAKFNYNPRVPWKLAKKVVVLAGVNTLRQAIRLKQQGRISKILAGPNIVVLSSDHQSVLAAPEIDLVITPSKHVTKLYLEDSAALTGRIFEWPAGVDTEYWSPVARARRSRILIFDKRGAQDGPARIEPYLNYLREAGFEVDVLVRSEMHSYTAEQYRSLLRESCLMVGFTVGSESQGIAWAEAWSTDVPTLIHANHSTVYQARRYDCSTAPYLCDSTGLFFDDFEGFKIRFEYWLNHQERFSPRGWVMANMSDEFCAALMLERVTEC